MPTRCLVLAITIACSPRADRRPDEPAQRAADAAVSLDAAPDAASPVTLDAALARLREIGFGAAADAIARRAAQTRPKLKLAAGQALAAALALLEVSDREPFRALHAVMPRSTVELARSIRERGVPIEAAAEIADYLVRFTRALAFERLDVFDENHSHVTGRDWPDIDYSGEGMTWQSQQADWAPRGVKSFKRREYIHAYFVGAERLPHWTKVYRPRGRVADVALR